MCLPFLCGGHEDHGSIAHKDTRQQPQPSDHGDGAYPPYEPSPLKGAHVVVGGKNGGAGGGNAVAQQGRRAADPMNKKGESTGAGFVYNSDSDVPASVGVGGLRGQKGAAEKIPASSLARPQAHGGQIKHLYGQHYYDDTASTTTKPQAPERKEHVAPVPQVARRDDDDDYPPHPTAAPTTAASERAPWGNFKR